MPLRTAYCRVVVPEGREVARQRLFVCVEGARSPEQKEHPSSACGELSPDPAECVD